MRVHDVEASPKRRRDMVVQIVDLLYNLMEHCAKHRGPRAATTHVAMCAHSSDCHPLSTLTPNPYSGGLVDFHSVSYALEGVAEIMLSIADRAMSGAIPGPLRWDAQDDCLSRDAKN